MFHVGRICITLSQLIPSEVIISYILMPCIIDELVIWQGELRCWSLLRCKGLKEENFPDGVLVFCYFVFHSGKVRLLLGELVF